MALAIIETEASWKSMKGPGCLKSQKASKMLKKIFCDQRNAQNLKLNKTRWFRLSLRTDGKAGLHLSRGDDFKKGSHGLWFDRIMLTLGYHRHIVRFTGHQGLGSFIFMRPLSSNLTGTWEIFRKATDSWPLDPLDKSFQLIWRRKYGHPCSVQRYYVSNENWLTFMPVGQENGPG